MEEQIMRGSSEPKKETEIAVLSNRTEELGEVFVGLADRLLPILSETASSDEEKQEVAPPSLPALIEEIRGNRFRVEIVIRKMKDILDRLEI